MEIFTQSTRDRCREEGVDIFGQTLMALFFYLFAFLNSWTASHISWANKAIRLIFLSYHYFIAIGLRSIRFLQKLITIRMLSLRNRRIICRADKLGAREWLTR